MSGPAIKFYPIFISGSCWELGSIPAFNGHEWVMPWTDQWSSIETNNRRHSLSYQLSIYRPINQTAACFLTVVGNTPWEQTTNQRPFCCKARARTTDFMFGQAMNMSTKIHAVTHWFEALTTLSSVPVVTNQNPPLSAPSSHLTPFLLICSSPCHLVLVGVCMCLGEVSAFYQESFSQWLSPHLKDRVRRGEAHLCHGWHFNLSPLAVLFLSILHQCIRTNAMGHGGISGFNTIDTHLWLRRRCSTQVLEYNAGEKRRFIFQKGDKRKVKSSKVRTFVKYQ